MSEGPKPAIAQLSASCQSKCRRRLSLSASYEWSLPCSTRGQGDTEVSVTLDWQVLIVAFVAISLRLLAMALRKVVSGIAPRS
jgi:hypothetical protein